MAGLPPKRFLLPTYIFIGSNWTKGHGIIGQACPQLHITKYFGRLIVHCKMVNANRTFVMRRADITMRFKLLRSACFGTFMDDEAERKLID